MKKNGFTLLEILIVMGISSVVLVTTVGILLITSKTSANLKLLDKLQNNATFVAEQLRRNVFNAATDSIMCTSGVGTSILMTNIGDGETTVLTCAENDSIASNSANLTESVVKVFGCANFVTCDTNQINFKYYLGVLDNDGNVGTTFPFNVKVTVRN